MCKGFTYIVPRTYFAISYTRCNQRDDNDKATWNIQKSITWGHIEKQGEREINFLLTESAVITGKYQTSQVLTVRNEPVGRGPYIKDRGLIFSSNDQAVDVNNRFIIWLFKQHTLQYIRIIIFNVVFLVVIAFMIVKLSFRLFIVRHKHDLVLNLQNF